MWHQIFDPANAAIAAYMFWSRRTLRASLLRAAADPVRAQEKLLRAILQENAETEFGQQYDFRTIDSIATYRKRVPVKTYDLLQPFIDRQRATGACALTAQPPVFYARTSGTTGRHKDVPLTAAGLRQVKDAQLHLAISLASETNFFQGSILGFAGAAVEGRFPSGQAYGSTSGITYKGLPDVLKRKFIVPAEVYGLSDYDTKYWLYALAALSADDITGIVTANPSSILKILDVVQRNRQSLLDAFLSGPPKKLPVSTFTIAQGIVDRARKNPSHIERLRVMCDGVDRLRVSEIWPRLSAIATWTGGSCGFALDELRCVLPLETRIVEYGYGASEFMGTANIDALRNICLPLLHDNFYEFVRRGDWEMGRDKFIGVEALEPGQEYYVFATARSGLYRYDINDVVVARPGIRRCPALQFLQKGRGVTNITGEKLSEHQVISAVRAALSCAGLTASFFVLLADEAESRYDLVMELDVAVVSEKLAADVDRRLQEGNAEYADKRASGRLGPVCLRRTRVGAGDAIKAESIANGLREAQFKPICLDYWRNWAARLTPVLAIDPAC